MDDPLRDRELDDVPPPPVEDPGPEPDPKAKGGPPVDRLASLGLVDAIGLGLLVGAIACGLAMLAARPTPEGALALAALAILPPLLWRLDAAALLATAGRGLRASAAFVRRCAGRVRPYWRLAGRFTLAAALLGGGGFAVFQLDQAMARNAERREKLDRAESRARTASSWRRRIDELADWERQALFDLACVEAELARAWAAGEVDRWGPSSAARERDRHARRAESYREDRLRHEEALARLWAE